MVEIKEEQDLLNNDGRIVTPGYSTSMLQKYDRSKIKARKMRIKEWDYYLIHNKDYAVALTVADNSYMSLLSASVIRFNKKKEKTTSQMLWFTNGKVNQDINGKHINMPSSSKTGDIIVSTNKCIFTFTHEGDKRRLFCKMKDFENNNPLDIDIILEAEPRESMVIATPFKEKKTAFYFNQKIIGFKASGHAKVGNEKIIFDEKDSLGLLDWGRGVWTYKNTWYWGAGMQYINDKIFGFNIGYGFGDTSSATENMLFYDGKAHKLEDVTFNIPKKDNKDDFMSPWTITSSDKRFEMTFTPIINRHSDTNALIIRSNQNQVFGYFNGTAVLDDGTTLEIKDLLGFAEKVYNKW